MTNLQDEMTSGEAELMWDEYCYHNMLCDIVEMMQRKGSGKVIIDIIDMYKESERIKNG
jgi:hypothetical protein